MPAPEESIRDASRFREVSRKKHQSERVVAQIYVCGGAKLELLLGIPGREMRRRSDLVAAHAVNLTALKFRRFVKSQECVNQCEQTKVDWTTAKTHLTSCVIRRETGNS